MNEPDGRRQLAGEHAWVTLMPWWHAGFAATLVGTAASVAVQLPLGWRLGVTLGLYAALAALYIATPGKFRGRGGLVYLVGALAIFGAATFVFPGSAYLLFILVPHSFMLLPFRSAFVALVGLILVNAGSQLSYEGASNGNIEAVILFGVLSVVLAVAFGGYISRIIGQSVRRAQLIEELERTRSELAESSHQRGALEERERLAREIHDALAQGFTSVVMVVQAAGAALERGDTDVASEQLALAEKAARDGLAEARGLMEALAPLPLRSADLAGAIARVCRETGSRFGFSATFEVQGEGRLLSRNAEIVLLRAAQVALVNVGRHSGAKEASARLSFSADHGGSASLTVSDGGRGFEPSLAGGFGLSQLRARAGELGGDVEVVSAPGEGTTVTVTVPAGCSPAPGGPAPGGADEGASAVAAGCERARGRWEVRAL